MRKTSITSHSNASVVTLSTNAINVATPIFKLVVPRGATYRLHNQNVVRGGLVQGTYIILDLRDSAGNNISSSSGIYIATRGPADEFEKKHRRLPYAVWHDLETVQQRNEDFKATIIGQTDLNVGPGIQIPEGHELLLFAESPQVINWSKSFVQIDFEELN